MLHDEVVLFLVVRLFITIIELVSGMPLPLYPHSMATPSSPSATTIAIQKYITAWGYSPSLVGDDDDRGKFAMVGRSIRNSE